VIKTDDLSKFNTYIDKLGASANKEIKDYGSLTEALDNRHQYFHEMGGRLSDHGLDSSIMPNSLLRRLIKYSKNF
jgi:glucuronate isomerase